MTLVGTFVLGLIRTQHKGRSVMTVCPIAIAVGCKKCPAFSVCPLKGVVGDYRKPDENQTIPPADDSKP